LQPVPVLLEIIIALHVVLFQQKQIKIGRMYYISRLGNFDCFLVIVNYLHKEEKEIVQKQELNFFIKDHFDG
jgi:hypothetical protein